MFHRTMPTWYHKTIEDIDFKKLYDKGIRNILCDLDNTLTAFFNKDPEDNTVLLINYLKSLGFNFYVISNNHKKRVSRFCDPLGIQYLWRAGKPGVLKVSLFMKKHKLFHDETVIIGDQIMTDIILANKLDIKSVLVEPVADQDLIVTKINRSFDHKIRKKLRLDGKLKGVE